MNKILEVYPYLRVKNASAAMEFYSKIFGAEESFCLKEPSGRIGHAEMKFGSATIMISDEYPEYGIHGPQSGSETGSSIHLHVEDVDDLTRRAIEAGAKLIMAPTDQFYGERSAKILDPFGHEWYLGSHIEDVTPEEMQRRFDAMLTKQEENDSPKS